MTRQNTKQNTLLWTLGAALTMMSACADDAGLDGDDETGSESEGETGDGDGDGDGDGGLLKLGGSYTDEWGTTHTITDTRWESDTGGQTISVFDNAGGWLVAQGDASNEFGPEKWSRFDFTYAGNDLYYCQSAFDLDDEAAALAATPADASDPATGGCGGMFAWTRLAEGKLEIDGMYVDEWESTHQVSAATWTQDSQDYAISQFDSQAQYAIAANGPDHAFAPDAWSRFDWVYVDNALYYCQTAFDAATEADALAAMRGDDSDPATGGCGGMFAWTKLQ